VKTGLVRDNQMQERGLWVLSVSW